MKQTFVSRKLSPKLEEVLMEELHTLKGGNGGNSDNWLDEVEIIGTPPPSDPEPDPDEDDPEPDEDPDPWEDPDSGWYDDHGWWGGENPDQAEDPEETPCDKAKDAGDKAKAVLNSDGVQQAINQSLGLPTALGQEAFFSITKDNSGNIGTTTPNMGNSWNVSGSNGADAIADFHTHANSNYPPGGADIITFLRDRLNGSPNLETSFIRTQDGTTYAIQVTDTSLMQDFYDENHEDVSGGNWTQGSTMYGQFQLAEAAFVSQGMSAIDAFTRATAFVMDRAGLSLLKAEATQTPYLPSDFAKIGVTTSSNPNNGLQFQTDDCP